jgi:GcrA cell cycle regulator
MVADAQVWSDKKIEELKKLWGKGLTTTEIGKKLNVSKNSVVGKVHRLGLKSRPSPIKVTKEEPKSKKSLPVEKKSAKVATVAPKPKNEIKIPEVKVKSKDKTKVADTSVDIIDLKPGMCKWPSGDPKTPNFHFCGKKSLEGKPYCAAHYAMAYTSSKSLKENKS